MSATQNFNLTEDLSKTIKAANDPEDIRAAVRAEAEKQLVAAADQVTADAATKAAADKAAADAEAAKVATGVSRTEVIGGREFTFEAENEQELDKLIINAYRVASAVQREPEEATVDPAKEAEAKAAAERAATEQAAARAELELKFKRGEISAADFIEQSGAVKDYLEKQGVPLEKIRASVEANDDRTVDQQWKDATEAFLHGPAGSDWPGGPKNLELIGLKLQSLMGVDGKPLTQSEDKVAALAQAWNAMKQSKMFFPAEVAATTVTATAGKTNAELAADAVTATQPARVAAQTQPPAAQSRTAATSSSIFGASSGLSGGGAGTTEKAAAAKVEIPKDASPAEILAAWKEQQIKDGKNPDAAFVETFQTRRA